MDVADTLQTEMLAERRNSSKPVKTAHSQVTMNSRLTCQAMSVSGAPCHFSIRYFLVYVRLQWQCGDTYHVI
jgi:hypothetical protein